MKAELDETVPFAERFTCTVKQAVALTGLSKTTIYDEMKAKKLASTTACGRRLIYVSSLKKLVGMDDSSPSRAQGACAVALE